MKPRLHPQSWRELRQLVLLHGLDQIRAALKAIEEEQVTTTVTRNVIPQPNGGWIP